jgi:hypothetical protein
MEKMQEAYCGCFARPKLRADKGLLEASHFFLIVERSTLALSIFYLK